MYSDSGGKEYYVNEFDYFQQTIPVLLVTPILYLFIVTPFSFLNFTS